MIYFTGDTHCPINISKFNSKNFDNSNLTKNDYVIILGDFGLIWDNEHSKEEIYLTKWLNDKPWITLFLCGNHENFDRLLAFPEVDMFGSKVGRISDSIFHLKRGHIYTIDDKKFLTIGGARSIDKINRTLGISWWEQEIISSKEIDLTLDNLEKVGNSVDYVLSHTGPKRLIEGIYSDVGNCHTSKFLDFLFDRITFKRWYFGHLHFDLELKCDGKEFNILFNDIVELK